jgi:hypothetical protein
VTPANAATVALYTYTPYEGYEYSSQYCARAYELTSENKDGLEVTGLAWIFYQYARSFPGSTSSATDVTPCSGKGLGQAIARWAKAELGTGACSNNLGVLGFTTPGTDSNSCGGCGGSHKPEYWCADFASWVWNQAGVKYTSQLGSSTTLFEDYGTQHDTWKTNDPQVGDAILFPEHVAIVVKTYGDGYVDTMSGDWGGQGNADCGSDNCCAEEVEFSNTSSVQRNTHYAGWVCASDDTKCLGSQNATMYANVIGIAGPVGGSATSCKATVTPAPSPTPTPTPTGPSSDDVCCATCVGQTSAYYAMQVPNLDGTLPPCSQAAQLFCTGTFGGGVSSSEISSCLVYGASDGGTTSSSGSCKLGSQTYPVNTCTETLQCDGSTWVPRTSDASGCNTGIEPGGACLTDSGSVAVLDTCTSTLQCNDGVWVDRDEDPALCNCSLAGRSYVTNTCTETVQCDDGEWVARDGDPSSCDTGFESNGSCLTDSGSVVPQNTCTSTLQCQSGVWVDRDDDPSSCL